MNSKYRSKMYDHIHFAVMAIEGGARRLHISGQKMHDRLKAQNLIHERLYLTKLRGQAESWAKTIASRGRNRKAFLNVYEFDTAAARRDIGQRYKIFDAYDIPWLDYVVDCRAGGNLQTAEPV